VRKLYYETRSTPHAGIPTLPLCFSWKAKEAAVCCSLRLPRNVFPPVIKKAASLRSAAQIVDKEGENGVFPSLWLAGENQCIDFPYFLLHFIQLVCDWMEFVSSLLAERCC
jgi:hypothetical protein